MDERAVGILEVYGLVCAFLAADAGCKAANVTLEPFDKNKPANADSLPVPLLVTIKFRGQRGGCDGGGGSGPSGGGGHDGCGGQPCDPTTHTAHTENAGNLRF